MRLNGTGDTGAAGAPGAPGAEGGVGGVTKTSCPKGKKLKKGRCVKKKRKK
jgi:hypothetical protein